MQTLLVIRGGHVTVQNAEKTYHDTAENFVLDGGSLPNGFSSIDYCKDTGGCLIDGVPADVPVYAENIIKRIEEFTESFESRKAEREEAERIEREANEEKERQEAEQARLDAMTLDERKALRVDEVKSWFETASDDAHCLSSVGFEINANSTAKTNIDGLKESLEAGLLDEPQPFRAYDNSFHDVTLANLKTMSLEVIANGQKLYQQKWAYEKAISDAQTLDELLAIEIG